MFWRPAHRMRTWLTDAGEWLMGPEDPELGGSGQSATPAGDAAPPTASAVDYHLYHPHRQDLRPRRDRRPGSVPARPAHCLCPVRREPAPRPIPYP